MTIQSFDDVSARFDEITTQIQSIQSAADTALSQVTALTNSMSELLSTKAHIDIQVNGIDSRITPLESTVHALNSQLTNVLVQMNQMIVDGINLKAEIMPYEKALAAGYEDKQTGIRLKADRLSQSKFTGYGLTLSNKERKGKITMTTTVPFWNYYNQIQALPYGDYLELIDRYSDYIMYIESQY